GRMRAVPRLVPVQCANWPIDRGQSRLVHAVSSTAGVLGEGSPLSGEEHTLPAVVAESMLTHHFTELNTHANPGNGVTRTTGFGTAGDTAPSANSGISSWLHQFL